MRLNEWFWHMNKGILLPCCASLGKPQVKICVARVPRIALNKSTLQEHRRNTDMVYQFFDQMSLAWFIYPNFEPISWVLSNTSLYRRPTTMKKVYEYKITFVIHSSRFEFDSMKRQSLMHVCKKRMKIGAWHIYIWGSRLKWIPRITIMIQNVHYHFTM